MTPLPFVSPALNAAWMSLVAFSLTVCVCMISKKSANEIFPFLPLFMYTLSSDGIGLVLNDLMIAVRVSTLSTYPFLAYKEKQSLNSVTNILISKK